MRNAGACENEVSQHDKFSRFHLIVEFILGLLRSRGSGTLRGILCGLARLRTRNGLLTTAKGYSLHNRIQLIGWQHLLNVAA